VEKTTIRSAKLSALLAKYYSGGRTKTNETGGTCGAYGREMFKLGSGGEP